MRLVPVEPVVPVVPVPPAPAAALDVLVAPPVSPLPVVPVVPVGPVYPVVPVDPVVPLVPMLLPYPVCVLLVLPYDSEPPCLTRSRFSTFDTPLTDSAMSSARRLSARLFTVPVSVTSAFCTLTSMLEASI